MRTVKTVAIFFIFIFALGLFGCSDGALPEETLPEPVTYNRSVASGFYTSVTDRFSLTIPSGWLPSENNASPTVGEDGVQSYAFEGITLVDGEMTLSVTARDAEKGSTSLSLIEDIISRHSGEAETRELGGLTFYTVLYSASESAIREYVCVTDTTEYRLTLRAPDLSAAVASSSLKAVLDSLKFPETASETDSLEGA